MSKRAEVRSRAALDQEGRLADGKRPGGPRDAIHSLMSNVTLAVDFIACSAAKFRYARVPRPLSLDQVERKMAYASFGRLRRVGVAHREHVRSGLWATMVKRPPVHLPCNMKSRREPVRACCLPEY
jgi:hypothetical protein